MSDLHELDVRLRLVEDETQDIKKLFDRDHEVHAQIMLKLNDVMLKKEFAAYVIEAGRDRKLLASDIAQIRLSQAETRGFKAAIVWIVGLGGSIGAAAVFLWDWIKDLPKGN